MGDAYVDRMEVFKGRDGKWYFRAKSNNGETLFVSEAYERKATAERYAAEIAGKHGVSVATQ